MVIKFFNDIPKCEHCNCGAATKVLPNGDKVCVPCAWVAQYKPKVKA